MTASITMTMTTTKLLILNDCKEIFNHVLSFVRVHPEFKYTLNDQLLRSSLSIGSNIAEGNQRRGKDRDRFLDIALGSLEECRFQLDCCDCLDEVNDRLDKIRATIIKLKSLSLSSSSSLSS